MSKNLTYDKNIYTTITTVQHMGQKRTDDSVQVTALISSS